MAIATKIIGFLTIISLAFGQLIKLQITGFSIQFADIVLTITAWYLLITQLKHTLRLKFFYPFIGIALFSLIFNQLKIGFYPLSWLYFLRLINIMIIFTLPSKIDLRKYIIFALITNLIFGIIQYFFWPDFRSFSSMEWDPHLYRLVGSFMDPTFTGLAYLLALIYLYQSKISWRYWLMLFFYFGLALTYSRSSLLCFLIAFVYLSLKRQSYKQLLLTIIIFISTLLALPRLEGEGTKLERSSSIIAKIQNYQVASTYFLQSPIIGHGYNNLPFIRHDLAPNNHAIGGFDGSLMTILVTTGLIGLIMFSLNLFQPQNLNLPLIIILMHSIFANSLLYPLVIIIFHGLFKYRK